MQSGTTLLWAVLALLAPSAASADLVPLAKPLAKQGFKRLFCKQGITVYKHRTAKIIRLAAEGRILAPPARVRRALLDYERHVGTISRVAESRVLARGPHRLLVYQRLDLPLISDRDFTLQVSWGAENEVLWTRFSTTCKGGPGPRKGVVRITTHRGGWQLKPVANGQATHARYEVTLDLAGWLPGWMARSSTGKEIPALFAAITRILNEKN